MLLLRWIVPLVLGDAAASYQPPAAEPGPGMYLMMLGVMLPSIGTLAISILQYLGRRAIDREDQDKEEVKKRLEKHEDRFGTLEKSIEALKSSTERRFGEMDHALVATQGEVKHVLSISESIRGAVTELKSGLENRFEKQSDFYRASLKDQTANFDDRIDKLEQSIRHDMTRAVADSMSRGGRRPR